MQASWYSLITEISLKEANLDYCYFLSHTISFELFYVHASNIAGLATINGIICWNITNHIMIFQVYFWEFTSMPFLAKEKNSMIVEWVLQGISPIQFWNKSGYFYFKIVGLEYFVLFLFKKVLLESTTFRLYCHTFPPCCIEVWGTPAVRQSLLTMNGY